MFRGSIIITLLSACSFSYASKSLQSPDLPQTFETCATVSEDDPIDAGAVTPLAKLTPSTKSIRVEVHFAQTYMGAPTDEWTPLERQYICAAARRMQAVWSSKEFQNGLAHLKSPLVLRPGHTILGSELYDRLTVKPVITLTVAISHKKKSGYAITNPSRNETLFPKKSYLDRPNRGISLIEDLTDSLSHEYTHYVDSVQSTDAHVVDNSTFVSYGIGCMTENLAVPGDDCWFDPSRPDLFRRK